MASALVAVCCGGTDSSSTTPQPSRTPDAASVVRTYAATLSQDLGPLQPVDVACHAGADACRTALDQAAQVATKLGEDLQRTPAEPAVIQTPVEDIRAAVRFVLDLDRAFDAGTMSVPEAVNAYMAEFNALEQGLHQVQAAH